MNKAFLATIASSLLISTALAADPLCASADEAAQVRGFYEKVRPGAPLPIAGRALKIAESKVASGLPLSQSVGTLATRKSFEQIWASMDTWGPETMIQFVVTNGGWHPFDFPSKMPITQSGPKDAFYDVYADGGKGVHTHINPELLGLIYATHTKQPDGALTRSVNFYDKQGGLVFAIYASEPKKMVDENAVEGFVRTWAVIEKMPRACVAG
jgi:putative heme iron utilization protein